jgi:hypothetical protein
VLATFHGRRGNPETRPAHYTIILTTHMLITYKLIFPPEDSTSLTLRTVHITIRKNIVKTLRKKNQAASPPEGRITARQMCYYIYGTGGTGGG